MENKQYDVVRLFLERGADFKKGNKHKKTILHICAEQGYKAICKELIETYQDDLNATTDDEMTPLHFAAQNQHKEIVQYLLEQDERERKEFYSNQKENGHRNENGNRSTSPQSKDELNDEGMIAYVNWQDAQGQTALHKVFLNNDPNIEIAKLLIQKGADVSLEDSKGKTALSSVNESTKQALLNETRMAMARKGL
jgi:ankyrin repeat protein